MTVWFTSDTHYGHKNVIVYANRPFESVEEMDESMIENWNEVVKPGDQVYHLGDFAFCDADRAIEIAKRLNGQKFLIFGNHDKRLRKEGKFTSLWQWAHDLKGIEVEEQRIVLCHYAMKVWNQSHFGAWQLFGHSHGTLPDDPHSLQIDVGVDCWGFQPVSFEMLKTRMSKKEFVPVDRHDRHDRKRE